MENGSEPSTIFVRVTLVLFAINCALFTANYVVPLFQAGGMNLVWGSIAIAAVVVTFLIATRRIKKTDLFKVWFWFILGMYLAQVAVLFAPANPDPIYYAALWAIGPIIAGPFAYWDEWFPVTDQKPSA